MMRSVLVEHAAELLGVSRRTIYYRIRDGRLQTVRTIGGSQRVLLDSIEVLLRQRLDMADPHPTISATARSHKSVSL
jgi:excisionase family DNA binding protein